MQNTIVNGEAMTASQENVLVVEQFLTENYLFRRNILNGKVEFAKKAEGEDAEDYARSKNQCGASHEGVGCRNGQLQQRSTLQGGAHENGLKQTNVRSDVRSRVRSGNQT